MLFRSGLKGDKGYQGEQGRQGNQGRQGSIGLQGQQGEIGAKGNQGNQGKTGANGQTGATGPMGPKGDRGATGATGPTGARGATGATGPRGATGPAGPAGPKAAILPVQDGEKIKYIELVCMEMPEVRFEDIMTVEIGESSKNFEQYVFAIDQSFIDVCELDSISVVGAMPSKPVLIGAEVVENNVVLTAEGRFLDQKIIVKLRLSGIRCGYENRRFAEHSYDNMIKNNKFWDSWKN